VRTEWKTNDIWLRRNVKLDAQKVERLFIRIHHDEDAEVYLNGQRIALFTGYQTDYIDMELDDSARKTLKDGDNVLAVHCRQTGGGQYIDVGLMNGKTVKGE
jgi:hypothetical protein